MHPSVGRLWGILVVRRQNRNAVVFLARLIDPMLFVLHR
jgi:hypothetical protein